MLKHKRDPCTKVNLSVFAKDFGYLRQIGHFSRRTLVAEGKLFTIYPGFLVIELKLVTFQQRVWLLKVN